MVRQLPFLFLSFVGACGLFVSCAPPPLVVSMTDVSPTARVGTKSIVKVRISNPARKARAVPTHMVLNGETLMEGVGASFVRSPDELGRRFGVEICPGPPPEELAAGESRDFKFAWEPAKEERGQGFVVLAVPEKIKAPEPVPVTVVP